MNTMPQDKPAGTESAINLAKSVETVLTTFVDYQANLLHVLQMPEDVSPEINGSTLTPEARQGFLLGIEYAYGMLGTMQAQRDAEEAMKAENEPTTEDTQDS